MGLETISGWWVSTKAPRNIFKRSYHNAEAEAFLRAHPGVDAAILAEQLGLNVDMVKAYQRRLGLRKCIPPGRRARGSSAAEQGSSKPKVGGSIPLPRSTWS